MSKIHSLYANKVRLDVDAHKYYDGHNREYMSFSRLYGFLVPKFNSDFLAGKVAESPKNDFTSKEAVLKEWNAATNEGTRIDAALELYAQTGQILESDADLKGIIEHVLSKYKVYNKCFEQLVVYDEVYQTAGSLDKLALCSNRKDSKFHISDFKCFDNGMSYESKGQAWLNYPLDHLPNNKYTKINIQLSYYARHFQKLTGRKCERMFVDMIIPKKDSFGKVTGYINKVIPMTYLKMEIECVLEYFKEKIINELEPVQMPELEAF
jgi:hypothetical protein